jgi:hypothetical protein
MVCTQNEPNEQIEALNGTPRSGFSSLAFQPHQFLSLIVKDWLKRDHSPVTRRTFGTTILLSWHNDIFLN